MNNRIKILAIAVLLCLPLGLLFLPHGIEQKEIVPEPAKFIISSWEYPDEYGQGIEVVWPYENSTGSWVPLHDPAFVFWYEETLFEVNATGNNALKIGVSANINHTLFDFGPDKADNASARAIMRVGIEVSNSSDIVFSLSNMTWDGSVFDDTATTWAISYADVINVLLVAGQIYTATITYEVFYAEGE